ncbi:CopD family protein [Labedaea rhizosphaerae]|uniref:Putative copper resistance protein D n=1 Tax=Labedaea rhizosphaerae TaxID=598644 RepID=A0A4R6SH78_LABRH|nr:CopD family protein [Labedaea rhizosphaerae]TDQ00278.1 putative copper resistance protein D [Labedaea rhizosphaerae]
MATTDRRLHAPVWPLVAVGGGLAVLCAVGLTLPVLRPAFGLPDPGLAVRAGLPAIRALAEIAAVLTVGALLAAAFLVPEGDRRPALDLGARCAGWWAVLAATMVPLTAADALDRTLFTTLDPAVLLPAVSRLPVALAWLVVAHAAALVWLGVKLAYPARALFALAVVGSTPIALAGHSSAGGSHDLAGDSLMLHITAASVWIGGLVAVLVIAGLRRDYAATAVRRFSALALGCWLVVAASGVLNAWLRLSPAQLFTSRYGVLVLAKAAALVVLGAFGYWQRRRAVPALDDGRAGVLLRLGGCEVLVMLATVGIAVGLGRTPAPAAADARVSPIEVLVGYPVPDPPSLARLVTDWRPDLVFLVVAILAAMWGVRRGHGWSWFAGCALLVVATCSGIGRFEPVSLSVHIGQQVLVGLAVPALLLHNRPSPVVRPAFAASAVLAAPLLWYTLGGFDVVAGQHWARAGALAWALVAGLALFARPTRPALLTVAAGYAFVGVSTLLRDDVLGQGFLARLPVPWPHDVVADQHLAGWLLVTTGAALALVAARRSAPAVTESAYALSGSPGRS